jgi:hypothetical protein
MKMAMLAKGGIRLHQPGPGLLLEWNFSHQDMQLKSIHCPLLTRLFDLKLPNCESPNSAIRIFLQRSSSSSSFAKKQTYNFSTKKGKKSRINIYI